MQPQNCPVDGNCMDSSIIYKATINKEDGMVNTYTGLTCNDFKIRRASHKYSLNNIDANQTILSSYPHDLNKKRVIMIWNGR